MDESLRKKYCISSKFGTFEEKSRALIQNQKTRFPDPEIPENFPDFQIETLTGKLSLHSSVCEIQCPRLLKYKNGKRLNCFLGTLQEVVRYIYSYAVDFSTTTPLKLIELLRLSTYLKLDYLVYLCKRHFVRSLTKDNVFTYMNISYKTTLWPQLKPIIYGFISKKDIPFRQNNDPPEDVYGFSFPPILDPVLPPPSIFECYETLYENCFHPDFTITVQACDSSFSLPVHRFVLKDWVFFSHILCKGFTEPHVTKMPCAVFKKLVRYFYVGLQDELFQ
eukprot:TRINITY_DN5690_c1_g1_i1.p1 TRINITY_DN5690_c1_g1~~TRINITY_DN5690_c1_g1_i1.p1  ORF type:complete len:278 (-),score=41.85 TRINITY_DN5690_c1_g1_i1:551-1384(-)